MHEGYSGRGISSQSFEVGAGSRPSSMRSAFTSRPNAYGYAAAL
jgi:hypothetical protein